jgi:hypothetical protein
MAYTPEQIQRFHCRKQFLEEHQQADEVVLSKDGWPHCAIYRTICGRPRESGPALFYFVDMLGLNASPVSN